jgi:hypothetical protein
MMNGQPWIDVTLIVVVVCILSAWGYALIHDHPTITPLLKLPVQAGAGR